MKYALAKVNRLGHRKKNQDRFDAVETPEGVLLVVADGMGGQPAGEVASEIMVQTARRAYLSVKRPVESPQNFLKAIIFHAHHVIQSFGYDQYPPINPGTTVVMCLIENGKASWVHVGDSRLYIIQRGLPIYRTVDHSYVEELVRAGKIGREEADTHPQRNQITRCVGCMTALPEVAVSQPYTLQPGDVVLLCTDGLWGALDDAQIGAMTFGGHIAERLDEMAEKAEKAKYPNSDNITVVAFRLLAAVSPPQQPVSSVQPEQKDSAVEGNASLKSAIEQITSVMKEYEKELKS